MRTEYNGQKRLGQNRELVTPIDLVRGSDYVSAVLSGSDNYTSGQTLLTVTTSNIVRLRPQNVHMHNRESSHMTLEFRDGGIDGTVVAGPYKLNPVSDRTVSEEELRGRYFTSSVSAVVISGAYSDGIPVKVGYVPDPDPNEQGGYLE